MYGGFSFFSHNRALAFAKHAKMGQNEPFFALFSYATWQICSKTWQCTPWSNTFSALCRRIVQALASYCLSRGLVLSNLSRRTLYLFVLRQKHPSSNKNIIGLGSVPFSVSSAISTKPVNFGYRCKVS